MTQPRIVDPDGVEWHKDPTRPNVYIRQADKDNKQMPIRMNITPTDVKAQKIVRPGWYPAEIKEVKQERASDGQSYNTRVDVVGLEGDAAGVPIPTWFSEKFVQSAIPFVKATGGRVTEEEGIDPDYDFEAQIGKRVMVHVVTSRGKTGNDKPRNQIDDWAPLSAATSTTPVTGGFDESEFGK